MRLRPLKDPIPNPLDLPLVPGFGFTHSLLYGLVIGLILWKVFGSKLWGLSFVVGEFAHALTDAGDTVGTMLLFPWTFHFHLDAWAYAGQTGRMTDAAAYFSGLGCIWDAVWIVYGFYSWRVLTSAYFDNYIYRADAFWPWLNREKVGEVRGGDAERGADDRAEERRSRVGREPAQRLFPVALLAEDEGDRVQAVGEVVADHRDEDEHAGQRVHAEGDADPKAV